MSFKQIVAAQPNWQARFTLQSEHGTKQTNNRILTIAVFALDDEGLIWPLCLGKDGMFFDPGDDKDFIEIFCFEQ